VLHSHFESEILIVSPPGLVFMPGMSKLMNFDPLDVMPCLMFVEPVTCAFGLN